MNHDVFEQRVGECLPAMPAQLQAAARNILDHPGDVALLTMREQARRAGLQPATMTRFAQRIGLEGYEKVRTIHAEKLRAGGSLGFSGKAGDQVRTQKRRGSRALAAEMAVKLGRQVGQLSEPEALDRLEAAAESLHAARRIYCLGLRSCAGVARHIHYILSLFTDRAVLLDDSAGTGLDAIRSATGRDVLVVVSVRPYTRTTIESARYAAEQGVPILALTDSKASPLAAIARHCLLVGTHSPSFFHSMTPAFAAGEMLATLAAGRGGSGVATALRRTEEQLAAFHVHLQP